MLINILENKNLNFFTVSLGRNIPIIKKNYINLKKLYKRFNLYIICPKKDLNKFKSELNYKNIQIINEDIILSKKSFSLLFRKYFSKTRYLSKILWRESWYYQQVLKISFAIMFFEKKSQKKLVQWEGDTIIIKKIKFYKNNKIIKYGTLFEKNEKYFMSLYEIFKKLPKKYLSFTFQFSLHNFDSIKGLRLKLNYYKKKNNKISLWISKIMLQSIINSHKKYHISLFSEQDLFGICQLLSSPTSQQTFKYFRTFTKGELSNFEINLLKLFNFYHITYDNYDLVYEKKSSLITFTYYFIKLNITYYYKKFNFYLNQ